VGQIPPKARWSRKRWALYWLFVVAVMVDLALLSWALEHDRGLALRVLAMSAVVAGFVFVLLLIRLLRHP
jgi:hypothetical protein